MPSELGNMAKTQGEDPGQLVMAAVEFLLAIKRAKAAGRTPAEILKGVRRDLGLTTKTQWNGGYEKARTKLYDLMDELDLGRDRGTLEKVINTAMKG